jgi:hypothetical protein
MNNVVEHVERCACQPDQSLQGIQTQTKGGAVLMNGGAEPVDTRIYKTREVRQASESIWHPSTTRLPHVSNAAWCPSVDMYTRTTTP